MKIVFLDRDTVGRAPLDELSELGEVVCYGRSTPEEAKERVRDCEVLIVNKVKVNAALMDAAPSLRLICVAATGTDNIDHDAAGARGIAVRNVAGYSTDSVVQVTFTHILTLLGNTQYFNRQIKNGTYSRSGLFTMADTPVNDIKGKTIGIIGMGAIGREVARIATAFGMKVIYYSTSGTSHCREYPSVSIVTLMKDSDVISIHSPLNDRTRGLVGAAEIALMKPSSILVNMGRGGIVDENALTAAVNEGRIGGAALDVYSCEPLPCDSPLLHTSRPDSLSLSPHVGWASEDSIARLISGIAANIREVFGVAAERGGVRTSFHSRILRHLLRK